MMKIRNIFTIFVKNRTNEINTYFRHTQQT